MKKFRNQICNALLVVSALVLFILSIYSVSLSNEAKSTNIIGINTRSLLALLSSSKAKVWVRDNEIVLVPDGAIKNELTSRGIEINIMNTVDEAKDMFRKKLFRQIGPIKLSGRTPGDQFACWFGGVADPFGKHSGWSAQCLMRRANVVFNCGLKRPTRIGLPDNAISLMKRIDNEVMNSKQFASRGDIQIPTVRLSSPPVVPLGQRVAVDFECDKMVKVRVQDYEEPDGQGNPLVSRGRIYRRMDTLGKVTVSLNLATLDNYVFQRNVIIQVIPVKKYEEIRGIHPWELPSKLLYFVKNNNTRWETTSPDKHEWITLEPGTLRRIKSEELRDRLSGQIVRELQNVLRADWIPDPEMMVVQTCSGTSPRRYVAYCSFTRRQYKIILMATLNKGFWIYIDQPYHLDKNNQALQISSVLKDSYLHPENQGHDAKQGLISRSVVRFRSVSYKGPFEHVRVLLIRVAAAELSGSNFPGHS